MDRQEIKLLFNYLENNTKHLTSLQHKFITSLREHYRSTGFLTKNEVECLYGMKEYMVSVFSEEAEDIYGSEHDKYQAQYSTFDYGTSISAPY